MIHPENHGLEYMAHDMLGDFREVDMQFNIGRLEGQQPRGLDVIEAASGDRYYITRQSSQFAENQIMKGFGLPAVLESVVHEADVSVYAVPEGSRLFVKTLRQSPYSERYMNRLAYRAGRFMNGLRRLDKGLFGVTVENLALVHSTQIAEDDALITVVPPVRGPGKHEPVSTSQILDESASHFRRTQLLPSFQRGLQGDGYVRS